MSIFKETFPKFVRDQLSQREKILASGTGRRSDRFNFGEKERSNQFLTYTANKQCTIRLTSGVKLVNFILSINTSASLFAPLAITWLSAFVYKPLPCAVSVVDTHG